MTIYFAEEEVGLEKLSDLPKFTYQVGGELGFEYKAVLFQVLPSLCILHSW